MLIGLVCSGEVVSRGTPGAGGLSVGWEGSGGTGGAGGEAVRVMLIGLACCEGYRGRRFREGRRWLRSCRGASVGWRVVGLEDGFGGGGEV